MANSTYWLEREQNKANLSAEQLNKALEAIYKQAYESINREIEKLWLEMLGDGEISSSSLYKYNRLNKLLMRITEILNGLGVQTNDNLQLSLLDTFYSTYDASNNNLGESTTLISEQIAKEVVNASYKNATYSQRVWENLKIIRQQIEKGVIDAAITGKDVKNVSRMLAERMGVSLSDAKRIVITETDRVLQESCRQSALSKGYRTYSILVERDACEDCKRDFKDKHFPLSKQVLPKHPHCKCCMKIDLD